MAGLPPFERYYAVRRFGPTLAFTPDGESVLFVANISGQFNLWRVPVSGGWPEQLTAYTDHTVRSIAVSRDGLIAFAADGDGDEYHRVYLLEPGGWPSELAGGDQVQHTLVGSAFSPDGSRIVFAANARTPSASEIWVQELAGGEPRPVFGEDMYAVPAAWSPDGSRVLAIEFRTNSDFSIHLVDAADGTSEELTPHDDPVKFEPGPWDADGSGFYLLTDSGSEFVGLARFDLEARSWSYLAQPDGDVEAVAASVDGRVLAWIENDRGWSKVRVRDLSTGEDLPEAQLPPGASHPFGPVLAVSPDGSRVAVLWDEARRGQNVYVVETATGESCRITDSSMGLVPTASLVEPELVSYPTWDGREVPAWLFRAAGDRPAPVVLYVHGGPESQERAGYKGFAQYLCSRGISVFATNIRGSTGYGKTYQRMIYRDWGNGDLRDWEAAASWLGAQSWVDGDRIGVLGGSYGGFAVLSCVSRLPDLFAAGVDIFGPSNLVSLIKSAPPTWWRGLRQLIGDAEEDEEALLAGSPLTYADQIRAPLLVIQGAKDPRVVQAESDQLVERLRELGTPVEYEIFEDEGHGFTRYTNEVRAWRLAVEFLERHLVEAGPAPMAGAGPSAPAT